MKKVALLAILIAVIASPAFAAWSVATPPAGWKAGDPIVMVPAVVKPIIAGIAQTLDLAPATAPKVDGNGRPVYDALTGKQMTTRTWTNYMFGIQNGNVSSAQVQLQGIKLEKIIPIRKVACGQTIEGWPIAKHTILEQGIDDVMTKWPLLYEVNGVRFRLTVIYGSTVRFGYPGYPSSANSRSHVEQYVWDVVWNAADFSEFYARLNYFKLIPAGVCETFAVTPKAIDGIEAYMRGWGRDPADVNYIPGVFDLLGTNDVVGAAARLEALMGYIDSICAPDCTAGWYMSGINAGKPDPNAQAILDNPTVPAASLLINDLWAAGQNRGLLTGK